MPFSFILWDLDDDPQGNVLHIAVNGVTVEEVEAVFRNPLDFDDSRWAHPVQDFAIPLFYLWHHENGDALWDAYATGYASVRGDVPASREVQYDLIAARQVDLVAFVLESNLLEESVIPAWLERAEQRLVRLEKRAQT